MLNFRHDPVTTVMTGGPNVKFPYLSRNILEIFLNPQHVACVTN